MFNRVPFDSISLRDCTAKGEGLVVMWQPESQRERPAPRERSPEGTRLLFVSSFPFSQLWAEHVDPIQWIIFFVS